MKRLACVAVAISVGVLAGRASAGEVTDAAKSGQIEKLRTLLDSGAPVDEAGAATPLYFAAQSGQIDAARLLLERGADPNARGKIGTPLMIAARRKHGEIAELLIANGANPNLAGGEDERTPLHEAAYIGADSVVRLLLDHGADTDARTRFGEPPLHEAVKKGRATTAEILRSATRWAPPTPPTESDLAAADLKQGRVAAVECTGCHELTKGKGEGFPTLWGVFGRGMGVMDGFPYSDVMRAANGSWDAATLDAYLSDPMMALPGTTMDRARVDERAKRWALIAYLKTLR